MKTRPKKAALLKAIRAMERACLGRDYPKPTTMAFMNEVGRKEMRDYFYWLERQAPMTAMMNRDFEYYWS